jgi:hypothetical protein
VNIPNIDTGLIMPQFEEIVREYVRVRAQEYYKWKDYQYAIKYAGRKTLNRLFKNLRTKSKTILTLKIPTIT